MYGLLEAADQIRASGRLSDVSGCPNVAMRGIRYFIHNHDLEKAGITRATIGTGTSGLGSHRLLLWGNPDFVRRAVPTFHLGDAVGFEIDPPLAQKGFGNRPGTWGVFTGTNQNRMFWKWEFERYWLFYQLWGRLSYDPGASDSIWMDELRRRFGMAAPDVLAAFKNGSGVINEIVRGAPC